MPREKGGARKAGGAMGASDDDGTSLTLTQRIEVAQDQVAAAASHVAGVAAGRCPLGVCWGVVGS